MICEVLDWLGRTSDVRREAAALRDDLLSARWMLDRASWELAAGDVSKWIGQRPADPERHSISAAAEYVNDRAREPDWLRSGRRVITVDGAAVTVVWEKTPESLRAVLVGARVVEDWVRSIPRTPLVTGRKSSMALVRQVPRYAVVLAASPTATFCGSPSTADGSGAVRSRRYNQYSNGSSLMMRPTAW